MINYFDKGFTPSTTEINFTETPIVGLAGSDTSDANLTINFFPDGNWINTIWFYLNFLNIFFYCWGIASTRFVQYDP